jgi:3-oxoacyl-[acyl-carrier-protein] synthase-1
MKRIVITGAGIVSSIGNNKAEVTKSLRHGLSGIRFNPEYKALGLRCHIDGPIVIDQQAMIERKLHRFMGDTAAYGYIAMQEAIDDAGLTDSQVSNPDTGIIVGSGSASHANTIKAAELLHKKGIRRVGPYRVTKTMGSTTSANLATAFKIKGINYSISSTKSLTGHALGAAGANEAIYSLLMMKEGFITASTNISELDPAMGGFPIVRNNINHTELNTVMSNSFGFGGTNSTLVFKRFDH